jgi:hypothetical protein
MTYRIAVLAALAVGCTAGDKGADSGDSGGTGTCPQGTYDGPVSVQQATVDCTDSTTVRFYANTEGWTDDGYVFAQETGNTSPGGQYSDEHDLTAYDWDACGFEDNLEQELTTDVGLNDAARNQSTVFSCAPDVHYDGSGTMTYAFAVNDSDGNLADCLAFGDDVAGMKNGTYDRVNEPSFDLGICSEGQVTQ